MSRKRGAKNRGQKSDRPERVEAAPIRLIGGQYEIVTRWPILALTLLSFLLSLPMFEPRAFWPAGYVAFVPWLTAVCIAQRRGWLYATSFALGAAFFLTHLRWMCAVTAPGWVLGSLYLASSFPLAAWPVRHLYRTRQVSVAIAFPIVWTAVELLRSRGPLTFPWFLLGHSQVRLKTVIQIADLAGVFGVTFMVAMVNGWLVDLLLRPILIWRGGKASAPRLGPIGTVAMLLVVGATVIYGRFRLGQHVAIPGPRISVLQGDYLLSPEDLFATAGPDQRQPSDEIDRLLMAMYRTPFDADKRQTYLELIRQATPDKPDMMVLPETPWAMYLNRETRELPSKFLLARAAVLQNEELARLAAEHQCYVTVGSLSRELQPENTYFPELRYNSAFVYAPGREEPARYDKIHLVLFGEYVPFRNSKHLFWMYRFLNNGPWNPWGREGFEYSLTAGQQFTTFAVQPASRPGDAYSFAITICYEDAIPHVFRKFVTDRQTGQKRVSFMLNISNDGWFGRGSQQAQHLATCAFRAVENRVGIARAVNTGVSGFITPDGSWYNLVGESATEPIVGGTGHRTDQVLIDPRVTFYSRHGDVFAWACTLLVAAGVIDALVAGRRHRRELTPPPSETAQ